MATLSDATTADEVYSLIRQGAKVNEHFMGVTPLFVAVAQKRYEVIAALLEMGAHPDFHPVIHPMTRAIAENDQRIIEMFVEAGADLGRALLSAIKLERESTIQFLLQQGANPCFQNEDGMTPLMAAAAMGNDKIVRQLLLLPHDINAQNVNGVTAVDFANGNYHGEITSLLMNAGAVLSSTS